MNEVIQSVINRFFLPSGLEARLQAQETAGGRLPEWKNLIDQLRRAIPQYAVQDFTNLKNDWCFILEILLHRSEKSFLDDDKKLLSHLGGRKRSLMLFVSIFAPLYYYYVSEMSYDYQHDQFAFDYYRPTELELEEVIQPLNGLMESKNYCLLP